jgi:hypothetical protein
MPRENITTNNVCSPLVNKSSLCSLRTVVSLVARRPRNKQPTVQGTMHTVAYEGYVGYVRQATYIRNVGPTTVGPAHRYDTN